MRITGPEDLLSPDPGTPPLFPCRPAPGMAALEQGRSRGRRRVKEIALFTVCYFEGVHGTGTLRIHRNAGSSPFLP